MGRLNMVLLAVVVAIALGVVASQHRERQLFADLERSQERSRQLDVEWGQLQLEQSTWAAHSRVEKIARTRLGMGLPTAERLLLAEPVKSTQGVQP